MDGECKMDLSELLNNSRLSSVCDHLVNGGDLDEYHERQSYAEEIKNSEKALYALADKYGSDSSEQDEISDIIGASLSTLRRTFFEMGMISGIKFAEDVHKGAQELKR